MTARNYKREYKLFHSSKKAKLHRARSARDRLEVGLKKGDPREVDHIKPMSEGGSSKRSNLRAVSKTTNRKKGKKLGGVRKKLGGVRKKLGGVRKKRAPTRKKGKK